MPFAIYKISLLFTTLPTLFLREAVWAVLRNKTNFNLEMV